MDNQFSQFNKMESCINPLVFTLLSEWGGWT